MLNLLIISPYPFDPVVKQLEEHAATSLQRGKLFIIICKLNICYVLEILGSGLPILFCLVYYNSLCQFRLKFLRQLSSIVQIGILSRQVVILVGLKKWTKVTRFSSANTVSVEIWRSSLTSQSPLLNY